MSSRNANGRSTIFEGSDGRWHGYVSMSPKGGGRRDRRHVSAATRRAVTDKVRDLERTRDAGITIISGRVPTLGQWLDHWLENVAAAKLRPSTLHRYRQIVRLQLKPKLGHHRLDRLLPEAIEAAWGQLLAEGLSPATVLQVHRVLSRAMKVAMQRGRVARNVCVLVEPPTVSREEVQPLTQDEARELLKVAARGENSARWWVALALGLRQGEAIGLAWDAVDLAAGTLTVRQALQRQKGRGLVLVPPKSRAGRRTIALPAPLVDALKAHRAEQMRAQLRAGPDWTNERNLVFVQWNGRPIDPRSDHRAWRALLKEAKVRQARLHDARHTAATVMLSLGVPARVVMQVLGHSQVSLTLGTYSHVVPELAEDAAERVGKALGR